jgi:Domain of unknown function (DUF1963)
MVPRDAPLPLLRWRSVAAVVAALVAGSTMIATPAAAVQTKQEETRVRAGAKIGQELRALAESGTPIEQQRNVLRERLLGRKLPIRTVDGMLGYAAPGVVLRPTETATTSWLGGPAMLADGATWPMNERRGRPLSHLATLDLAQLGAPEPLPADGHLVLSFDIEGMENDRTDAFMDIAASADARWIPAGAAVREAAAPKPAVRYPRLSLVGATTLIIGGWDFGSFPASTAKTSLRAEDYAIGVASGAYTRDQLLGASQDIQGPVADEISYWFKETSTPKTRRPYSASERKGKGWTLLAQVGGADTDEMMFADGGNVSFLIPTIDLAARRFDRVVGILQSY